MCLIDYFLVVKMLLGNESYNIRNPGYFPCKCCNICKEHTFVGGAAELRVEGLRLLAICQIFSNNAKQNIVLLTLVWILLVS